MTSDFFSINDRLGAVKTNVTFHGEGRITNWWCLHNLHILFKIRPKIAAAAVVSYSHSKGTPPIPPRAVVADQRQHGWSCFYIKNASFSFLPLLFLSLFQIKSRMPGAHSAPGILLFVYKISPEGGKPQPFAASAAAAATSAIRSGMAMCWGQRSTHWPQRTHWSGRMDSGIRSQVLSKELFLPSTQNWL